MKTSPSSTLRGLARVRIAGAVQVIPPSKDAPTGVFVERAGGLILSTRGRGGAHLALATADDAARLGLAMLTIATAMDEAARRAAPTTDPRGRNLAGLVTTGHG